MNFIRNKIFPIVAAAILSNSVNAASLDITIKDIAILDPSGNALELTDLGIFGVRLAGFTWEVTPYGTQNVSLSNVGDSQTVAYASFGTDVFSATAFGDGIDPIENIDNNDYFTSKLTLDPPDDFYSKLGEPDANNPSCGVFLCKNGDGSVYVNFDNSAQEINDGNGNLYTLKFLDSANLTSNGSVDLEVELTWKGTGVAAGPGSPTSPVPVPPALLLMGSGLFGIAAANRRRKVKV